MKKTTIAKIVLLPVLLLIIWLTFRGSLGDIVHEIRRTAPILLIAILASSVVYHFVEAWITWSMVRCYEPGFRYRSAVYLAFYSSFFRLATLGGGTGVAQVFHLKKLGVGYSECISMFTIQYVVHRISMAIFVGLTFLISMPFMIAHFRSYLPALIFAFVLTVLICIGLVLLICWRKSHALILAIINKFNKGGRLDGVMKKLKEADIIIHEAGHRILGNKKLIAGMVFKNLLKFVFWYTIPYILLASGGYITFLQGLAVTSLGVLTAAVIPTPAGVGSSEFVLGNLYRVIAGASLGGAVTILYRIATFVFPFAVGGILILLRRIFLRRQGVEDERLTVSDLQRSSGSDREDAPEEGDQSPA